MTFSYMLRYTSLSILHLKNSAVDETYIELARGTDAIT